MSVKILVAGGAGYIGSILCRKLLADPHYDVTVFDNFTYGTEPLLPLISNTHFSVVEGDIRDESLKSAVEAADIVIHLAAIVGFPACMASPEIAKMTNVQGTRNVLKYASKSQRIIYASTGSVYGKVEGLCSEDTSINPLTIYGITKYEGEKMVMDRGNATALRFSTVFGVSPRFRMDLLVNDLVFQALRYKAVALFQRGARRSFLHCDDTAESYMLCLRNCDTMNDEVFNVGHPELNLTKHEVVLGIQKYIDFHLLEEGNGTDPDERDYAVDFTNVMNVGFRPRYTLDDGIKELLKIYSVSSFYRFFRNC